MFKKTTGVININDNSNFNITIRHHVIFWVVYFLFTTFRWGSYFNDYEYAFKTTLLGFSIHMTLCYFNLYYLMPKFIYTRKYFVYGIVLSASLFFMLIIKFNLTYFLVSNNVWPEGPEVTSTLTLNYAIEMMMGELYVITFVTAIKVTFDWIREHKRLIDMEKLQLETELRLLRTQISPHFFFNTLNNIYSLTIEKSDKAPRIILKLSELMRYLLYETKQKRQSLTKEIICLQNYLDLERIRYGDQLKINIDISGDIEDKEIAPMLLLSFIENSFKHGANKNIGEVKINIDFNVIGDFLHFRVSNPIAALRDNNAIKETHGGIGIDNVKKRLELGYKEGEYYLDINSDDEEYIVTLKIKVV
ncbi:sensor histidine kinase [Flavivirga jejuensis]|uniref:Sensor histidine kinase n=1 Tax=Flavivirga jejuensis TaxID=870487 RepID=A0ABT8WIV1_9FLAO|nr:sensor histidine kinase [Flavivirga jejuensis]MDO5973045.1 sensor histidine kinase [Flavivirga jejuensis]